MTMVTMVVVDPKCLFKLVNNMMKPHSKKFMLMVMENLTKVCRFKPILGGSCIFLRIIGFVSFFMLQRIVSILFSFCVPIFREPSQVFFGENTYLQNKLPKFNLFFFFWGECLHKYIYQPLWSWFFYFFNGPYESVVNEVEICLGMFIVTTILQN